MMRFFFRALREKWQKYRFDLLLSKLFPSCSFEQPFMIKGPLKNLSLGEKVQFQANIYLHLGGEEWCHNQGKLAIGANSCLSPNVVIFAAGPGGVKIGTNFDCGPGVGIFSSRSDYNNRGGHIFAPVEIGDNVILFANVVVSPGVKIGNGAVVAANAVVTTDIPPHCLAGGIPAKVIRNV